MGKDFGITSNARKVLARYERLPKQLQTAVRRGLGRGLILAEENVRLHTGVKSSGASGVMGRLTSFVKVGGLLSIDGIIGFRRVAGFPYEMAQEFGAKAAPGKAMSVPLTPEAKRAGSPLNFPGELAMIVRAGKPPLLVRSDKGQSKGATRPQYVLLKSIKPRLGFRKNVNNSTKTISRMIVNATKKGTPLT